MARKKSTKRNVTPKVHGKRKTTSVKKARLGQAASASTAKRTSAADSKKTAVEARVTKKAASGKDKAKRAAGKKATKSRVTNKTARRTPKPAAKQKPATTASRRRSAALAKRAEVVTKVTAPVSFPIVGVGASAGGLQAFEEFFSHLPRGLGMAFVLVSHLDPDHASILHELLQRSTAMPVQQVTGGVVVEPNRVYVGPPGKDVAILNGRLQLMEPVKAHWARLPIDYWFRSLAEDHKEKAVGIILSGNGSDGTLGIKAIKGESGMVMAQDPQSAKFPGMPSSAIATGLVDFVLPVDKMPQQLIGYTRGLHRHCRQVLSTGGKQTCEIHIRTAKGAVLCVRLETVAVEDDEAQRDMCRMAMADITERKQAEEELRESEQKYRQLFEHNLVAVYRTTLDGTILDCNESMATMFGYASRRELMSCPALDLYFECPERAEFISRLKENGSLKDFRLRMRRKDGTPIDTLENVVLLSGGQGTPTIIQGTIIDVTEHERAQEALQKSEAFLRATGQMAKVGGWELDAVTKEVRWTEETYRIHEVPLDYKFLLDEAIDFYDPQDRPKLTHAIDLALEHGEPFDLELRFITAKGKRLWTHVIGQAVVVNGKTVGLTGTFQDITDRKRAEVALRESEERFRNIFENSPLGIYRTTPAGQVLLANPHLLDMLGYASLDELAERNLESEGYHPDYPRADFKQEIEDAGQVAGLEATWIRKDGTHVTVRENARGVRAADGQVAYYEGTVEDITERRQAEQALRDSEQRYRTLVDNIDLGIALIDVDYRIVMVNASYGKMFGRTSGQFVGKKCFAEFEKRDAVCLHCAGTRAMATGKPAEVETEGVRDDGNRFAVRIHAFPVCGADGTPSGFIEVSEDITVRRQAEEALRESRHRLEELERIVNRSPAVAFLWRAEESWPVEYASENVAQFGYTPADFYDGRVLFADLVHPDDRERVVDEVRQCSLRGQEQFDQEYRITTASGATRWVDDRTWVRRDPGGKITHYEGIILDITERKRTQEELRGERDFAESLIQTAQAIVLVLDPQGRIIRLNPYMEQLSGYRLAEVEGKDWVDVFLPERDRDRIRNLFTVSVAGIQTHGNVNPIVTKDGHEREIEWYDKTLKDSEGNVAGVVAVGQDITERKRAEEELVRHREHLKELVKERTTQLEQAHEKLLQQDRLATLGRLTATVGHELRNPLGTIRASFFSVAEETRDKGLAIEDVLDRADRNIARCDRIIEELLDYARTKLPELLPTRIDEWLADVLDEQKISAEISVERALEPDTEIAIDREKFRRCVVNLVTNACQAIQVGKPAGGVLTVETASAGGRLEIRFIDSGPGIPPDQMEKIFEPLYSTKGFGVGLGLPIVKQLMEMQGGGVEIESKPDEGTRATLWLPLRPLEGAHCEQIAYHRSGR